MATSSFTKDFTLRSQKEVDSFIEIITTKAPSVDIDRTLTSPEKLKEAREKLKNLSLR